LLTLADFLSGVTLRVRRGSQTVSTAPRGARRSAPVTTEAKPEPKFVDPATSAPAPVAAPAESLPPDHPHSEIAAASPSPEVASPELQPGNGVPRPPGAPPQ
jgi:hypothetical protein